MREDRAELIPTRYELLAPRDTLVEHQLSAMANREQ
jgi:hypothetical protein